MKFATSCQFPPSHSKQRHRKGSGQSSSLGDAVDAVCTTRSNRAVVPVATTYAICKLISVTAIYPVSRLCYTVLGRRRQIPGRLAGVASVDTTGGICIFFIGRQE
jgi:hypothetical protein